MAILKRHLIFGLVTALAIVTGRGIAAPPQDSQTSTFKALIISLDRAVISDLFYDSEKSQIRLLANTQRLSRAYPIPSSGTVSVYRLVPPVPPEDQPTKVPVAEFKLDKNGPWLVLMKPIKSPDGTTTQLVTQTIDASLSAHPRGTINVYNFCGQSMAIKAGDEAFDLKTGQSRLVSYPNSPAPNLWLKCAVRREGNWSMEISRPQTIVPGNTRAIWLLYDQPGTRDDPQDKIIIKNLVEPLPPPATD